MSETESNLTSKDARKVVAFETNQAYNPVVSTEEVAYELGCHVDRAEALLEEIPSVRKKAVSDTYVWW